MTLEYYSVQEPTHQHTDTSELHQCQNMKTMAIYECRCHSINNGNGVNQQLRPMTNERRQHNYLQSSAPAALMGVLRAPTPK